jgi:hypothetical protein
VVGLVAGVAACFPPTQETKGVFIYVGPIVPVAGFVRGLRVGVRVVDGVLTIRNSLRTRAIPIAEIEDVRVKPRHRGWDGDPSVLVVYSGNMSTIAWGLPFSAVTHIDEPTKNCDVTR